MIIRKMALPRRTFLRGLGAAIALPMLDAMVPALSATSKTAANPARRLGFIYFPHGSLSWAKGPQNLWTPPGSGRLIELSPILASLEPFRDQLVVLTNLEHRNAIGDGTDGNGAHTRSNASWLSAARPKRTAGADVGLATTVDQIAARELGKETRLPSLEMSLESNYVVGVCDAGYNCAYVNCMSWSSPTTPLPMENNPGVLFERMFGEGGDQGARQRQMRKNRSVLDSVSDAMARLQRTLGPADRTKMSEYMEAVREVERRIQKTEQQSPSSLELVDRPVGIPGSYDEHAKLMFDMQLLAFQADITRVFTLMLGRELSPRTYPWIGVPEGHHGISHHQDDPKNLAKIAKINTYHTQLLAYFLTKLHATSDGDGSLLDHSMILFGSGMSNGNLHDQRNLPLVLAGGGAGRLQGGRHIRYTELTPMANLLLGLLDKAGIPLDKFGDSTGKIDLDAVLTI